MSNAPIAAVVVPPPQAAVDDWVYYPKTKVTGLVILIDSKTKFMKIQRLVTMDYQWRTICNFGQYKVL